MSSIVSPLPTFPKWRKKVIVAGGRDFKDKKLLTSRLNKYTFLFEDVVVITGAQKSREWDPAKGRWFYFGADYLAEEWAHSKRYLVMRFHPDWDKHGKKAGPIRNREMAAFGDYLVAFWDGKSKGTANMIEEARKANLKIKIVRYH